MSVLMKAWGVLTPSVLWLFEISKISESIHRNSEFFDKKRPSLAA